MLLPTGCLLCRYERYLQMRVDKTAQGQALRGYNTTLLEVRGAVGSNKEQRGQGEQGT